MREDQKRPARFSRRQIVGTGLAMLAAPYVMRNPASAQTNRMTFVTWGGAYREAMETAVIAPFSAETGIEVTVIDTPDLAKVKAQVSTGNVEWDVFDAVGAMATSGAKAGYWEDLDPALFNLDDLVIAPKASLAPIYNSPGVVAFDAERFPEGKHPRNFVEYFDVEAFPGRRTLRARPSETLEIALLADGVDPAQLYPLDVDRAFAMLERIKPSIAKWAEATQETVSLLQTKEVDFSYSYPTRIKNAGAPISCSFEQSVNQTEYFTVLKGAPNKENAFRFVSFILQPQIQADLMNKILNSPVSKGAMTMLTDQTKTWLPDRVGNPQQHVMLDDAWWADNFEDLNRRFKEWILT